MLLLSSHSIFRFLTCCTSLIVLCGRWYRRVSTSTQSIGHNIKFTSISCSRFPSITGCQYLKSHVVRPSQERFHSPDIHLSALYNVQYTQHPPDSNFEVKTQVIQGTYIHSHSHVHCFKVSVTQSSLLVLLSLSSRCQY